MKKLITFITSLLSMEASATEYAVEQTWEYQTRPNEEISRLYIVHIDTHNTLGKIYHIYVDGVQIKNPHVEGGIQSVLPHAPVDEKTLKDSLTKFVGITSNPPDISEGYGVWKEAFDSGDGGVFNIPVKQIIKYIEEVVGNNT